MTLCRSRVRFNSYIPFFKIYPSIKCLSLRDIIGISILTITIISVLIVVLVTKPISPVLKGSIRFISWGFVSKLIRLFKPKLLPIWLISNGSNPLSWFNSKSYFWLTYFMLEWFYSRKSELRLSHPRWLHSWLLKTRWFHPLLLEMRLFHSWLLESRCSTLGCSKRGCSIFGYSNRGGSTLGCSKRGRSSLGCSNRGGSTLGCSNRVFPLLVAPLLVALL